MDQNVLTNICQTASFHSRYLQNFLRLSSEVSTSSNNGAIAETTSGENNNDRGNALLRKLLDGAFYLQVVEIVGLCSISFVHNREHYREFIRDNFQLEWVASSMATVPLNTLICVLGTQRT